MSENLADLRDVALLAGRAADVDHTLGTALEALADVIPYDLAAVLAAISREPDGSGRPRVIVAHTVKGKGVSFMEDDNNWHYRIPTADEVRKARIELGQPEVRA